MNAKKWSISFILGIIILMIVFMFANFCLDSVDYFAVEKNKDKWGAVSYFKAEKIKRIDANAETYTGFVIGGSKSGTVDTEKLKHYTGDNWFNLCVNSPTFHEYYLYIDWLSENTNVKEIWLYLSGHEINRRWNPESMEPTRKVTQIIIGDDIDVVIENLYYLTLDIQSNVEYNKQNEVYKEKYYYDAETGMIEYLSYSKIDNEKELKKYVEKNVLDSYESNLETLFNGKKDLVSGEENIKDLKNIIKTCTSKDINLTVVLGPTFIGELAMYESEEYYKYLKELVSEVPIWDFSGINALNMNPYNFIETTHCNYKMNNLVVDTVYQNIAKENVGALLNENNIDQYINNRKKIYNSARKEYKNTGTVILETLDKQSYLGR